MRLRPLRVLSVCSGISAASVAWKPLGFEFVGFAEIDPFACHVLAQRCGATAPKYLPDGKSRAAFKTIEGGTVINFGDLTQISDDDLRALGVVDILEGGTPCQGFSLAGLRGGLGDPRGALTLAFVILAHRMRKLCGLRYAILENVDGIFSADGGAVFGSYLAAMVGGSDRALVPPGSGWTRAGHASGPSGEVGWRTLDAQFWGLPQRRKRCFSVSRLGTRGPCPGEILGERGARDGSSGTGQEAEGAEGQHGHPAEAGGGALGGDRAIVYIGGQGERAGSIGASETLAPTLKASQSGSMLTPYVAQLFDRQASDRYAESGVASTLRSNTSAGYDHDLVVQTPLSGRRALVRRLMPVESERLMGFPDGWTAVEYRGAPAADTPRYVALGNSIAIPCLRWIGERLLEKHHRYWSKYNAHAA